VFFPFVLLSIADSGSVWIFSTGRIRRSLSLAAGSWTMFWVTSGLTVIASGLICVTAWGIDRNVGAAVTAFATIATALIYFRLLGRLGWMIGEADSKRTQDDDKDDEED
jgi:hypothetical protein